MEIKLNENTINEILDFHCPRFNELPSISLYKDQVILYIEETLKPLHVNSQEKLLTPTMLNNYVKQKVVSPPKDRRYNEKHLAYLIVVCLLKQVYSLTEVCELIKFQIETCPIEDAYDYFCVELERSLTSVFTTRDFSYPITATRPLEAEIMRSAVMSFSHKIYIQKHMIEMEKTK